MTCIVAVTDGATVVMGADSAGTADWAIRERRDPKIYRNGPFLMGFTTSYRMGQLIGYELDVPEQRSEVDTFQFMCTIFIGAVRRCLINGGFASVQNGREEGGTFLCAYRGRIFQISSDFQVGECAANYDACGSGAEVAMGSLFSTVGHAHEDRIRIALSAAAMFASGVRGPFQIERAGGVDG